VPECAHSPSVNTISIGTRPLVLQVGDGEIVLVASDVSVLLDAIERLADGMRESFLHHQQPGVLEALRAQAAQLESLRDALATPNRSLLDPPLEVTHDRARLLREVLADITGYQRGDLTPGLRDLRRLLSEQ
jgi:hypothetical protein